VRVGLVGYSGSPHTIEDPTDDRDRVRAAVESLSADGATATGDSLQAALTLLDQQDESDGEARPTRAIVLLSDGESTTGVDPVAVARLARREGVPIHTVALGTRDATIPLPGGGLIPVPPDPETLRAIARESGGRAFTAAESGELTAVYRELGSRIGSRTEEREITAAFAAGGLVLLLLAAGVSLRTRGRLP
jgi:Ca-activated chloride channel family protein